MSGGTRALPRRTDNLTGRDTCTTILSVFRVSTGSFIRPERCADAFEICNIIGCKLAQGLIRLRWDDRKEGAKVINVNGTRLIDDHVTAKRFAFSVNRPRSSGEGSFIGILRVLRAIPPKPFQAVRCGVCERL